MKDIILFLFFIVLIAGCKKTTIVSGTITSSADQNPVEGVEINLYASRSTSSGNEILSEDLAISDSKGAYSVEVEGKNADAIVMTIERESYVQPKAINLKKGECKTLDYIINPFDAWLSVTFENQSNTLARNFYFNFTGLFYENRIQGSNAGIGPFVMQPGESRTELIKIAGGQEITIKWDTISNGTTPFVNHIVVFCNRNDTIEVQIHF